MATQTIKLPTKVIDSDWKDDVGYETYADEGTYVSPSSVSKETISKIKKSSIKLSMKGLWDWKEEKNEKLVA